MADNDKEALSCTDKLAFDTKAKADAAAAAIDWQHGAKLKSYRCRQCGLWHLTSKYKT